MKKIIFIILLLLVASNVFAARTWNPWALGHWQITVSNGDVYNFRFNDQYYATDLDTGEVYRYDWGYDNIMIIDHYFGEDNHLEILADFGDWEYTVEGEIVGTGLTVTGQVLR